MFFKNEKSLFLGKTKAGDTCTLSLARKVTSLIVEKTSHDSERIERKLQTFDSAGSPLGCFWFRNPLYSEHEERKIVIPAGHDLVGVSLTTDMEGYVIWVNLTLWPQNRQIL